MQKITLIIVGIKALLLSTVMASAADMPRKGVYADPLPAVPVISWTGFYVGLNGGVGWQRDDLGILGADKIGTAVVTSGFVPPVVATRGDGGLFGLTVGYNWQYSPRFVFGIEGDIDWTNIRGNGSQALALGPYALNTYGSQELNWIGTVRGRAGYLLTPTSLVYGTAGVAFGGVESISSITLVAPAPYGRTINADVSSTKVGWTAGLGLEQMFANRWSVKAEYRYVDLGGVDGAMATTFAGKNPITASFVTHQDYTYHMFLAGLNYRFTGP